MLEFINCVMSLTDKKNDNTYVEFDIIELSWINISYSVGQNICWFLSHEETIFVIYSSLHSEYFSYFAFR